MAIEQDIESAVDIFQVILDSDPKLKSVAGRLNLITQIFSILGVQLEEFERHSKAMQRVELHRALAKVFDASEELGGDILNLLEMQRRLLESERALAEERMRIGSRLIRFHSYGAHADNSELKEATDAWLEFQSLSASNLEAIRKKFFEYELLTYKGKDEGRPGLRSLEEIDFSQISNSGFEDIVSDAIERINNLTINFAEAGEIGEVAAAKTAEAWSATAEEIESAVNGSQIKVVDFSEEIAKQIQELWVKTGEELDRAIAEMDAAAAELDAAAKAEAWAQLFKEVGISWEETGEQLLNQWESGWRDLLRGSTDGFESFAKNTLQTFEGLISQTFNSVVNRIANDLAGNLARSTFQPIFGSIFPSAIGNAGNFFVGSPALNALGAQYFGLGQSIAPMTTVTPFGAVHTTPGASVAGTGWGGTTITLSQLAAGAMAGFAGYGLAGLVNTPRSGPGNEIGAAAGGLSGFALGAKFGSFGGPIGAGIGAFAGALLGGLIGPRPSDRTEGFNVDFGTGVRTPGNLGPGKRSQHNLNSATAIVDAIMGWRDILESVTGGSVNARNLLVEAGSQDGIRVGIDGRDFRRIKDPTQAIIFAVLDMVEHLEGLTPRMQEFIDGLDFRNLEEATVSLERAANAQLTLESIRDQIKQITDPRQYAIDQLDAEFDALREVFNEFGLELTDLETLYDLKFGQIEDAFGGVADAIDDTADSIGETADDMRAVESAWADVLARVRENTLAQLDALDAERRVIEENIAVAENLLRSIQNARLRFVTDSRISSLSNETRLDELLRILDETHAKALAGDDDAAARIPELVLAVAEANRVFNASSEESARIERHLQNILNETESTANRELEIARENLAANEEQVALLRQQLDQEVPGAPLGPPVTFYDLDKTNKAFSEAIGAALKDETTTLTDFVNGALFRGFEESLLDKLGRADASTIPLLKESLAHQRRVLSDPSNPFHSSASRLAPALEAALSRLGVDSLATGGVTNGLALIHPGELLYTGPPARVFNRGESAAALARSGDLIVELRATRSAINSLSGTVSAANDDQVDGLNRMTARLGSIESSLELTAARA